MSLVYLDGVEYTQSVHDPEWSMYRVRHDFEIQGGFPRDFPNCPEVFKIEPSRHVALNAQWQKFWMSLNMNEQKRTDTKGVVVTPELGFYRYTSKQVAFTDRYDSDSYADFNNGTNLDQSPIAIEYIICGGAMVLCKKRDEKTMWIKYLDIFKPPPFGITWRSHPHLIYHATNTVNGQYANPFGVFGGRQSKGIVPVYVPLIAMSNHAPYIFTNLLTPVKPDGGSAVVNGQRYSPINPYYPAGEIA